MINSNGLLAAGHFAEDKLIALRQEDIDIFMIWRRGSPSFEEGLSRLHAVATLTPIYEYSIFTVYAVSPKLSAEDIPPNIDVMLYDDDNQPTMRVVGYATESISGSLAVSILFEPQTQLTQDYSIWMHGLVDDPTILPPDQQESGYENFGEVQERPTSDWIPNEPYIYTRGIRANPGEYTLRIGLWVNSDIRLRLRTADGNVGIELGTHEIRAAP